MTKRRFVLIVLIATALSLIIAVFALWRSLDIHPTVQQALGTDNVPVRQIDFDQGQVALIDTGTELKAVYLKKSALGWHKEFEHGPILKEAGSYRQLFSFFPHGDYTFIYGYDAGRQVTGVAFSEANGGSGIYATAPMRSDQLYWHIVLPAPVDRIEAKNLIITTIEGMEVNYPFSELDRFLSSYHHNLFETKHRRPL